MRRLARYAREHRHGPLLAETVADLDALGEAALGAHMALVARGPDPAGADPLTSGACPGSDGCAIMSAMTIRKGGSRPGR